MIAIIGTRALELAPLRPIYAQGGLISSSGFKVYNPCATAAWAGFTFDQAWIYDEVGIYYDNWRRGFKANNPNIVNAAHITSLYYDSVTGTPAVNVPDTIAPNSPKTYFPLGGLPIGFKGWPLGSHKCKRDGGNFERKTW